VEGGEYMALRCETGPFDSPKTIDFAPNGDILAVNTGERISFWDLAGHKELPSAQVANAHSAYFNADGRNLLISTHGALLSYAVVASASAAKDRARVIRKYAPLNELKTMAVTPDRRLAALVHQDEVVLLDLVSASPPRRIALGQHCHRLALHPEGTWLAGTVKDSNAIQLWSLDAGTSVGAPSTVAGYEYFTFDPTGRWFAACWGEWFQVYRVGAWQQPAFVIQRRETSAQHAPITFSRNGEIIAIASSRYLIELWRIIRPDGPLQPERIATVEHPDRSPLEMLTFSSDGAWLATATKDNLVQLWNLKLLAAGLARLGLEQHWEF
jgi:WD40 repeat protein